MRFNVQRRDYKFHVPTGAVIGLFCAQGLAIPASAQELPSTCGTYRWAYPEPRWAPNGAEDHYIVLECRADRVQGWYYGTSDDFDRVREGYTPGHYVKAMQSLQFADGRISFMIGMPVTDYFNSPVPLHYRSHDQIPKGLLPQFPHKTAYGITRQYRGTVGPDSIRLETPWYYFPERVFTRIDGAVRVAVHSDGRQGELLGPSLIGVVELPALFQAEMPPSRLPPDEGIPVHASPDASATIVGAIRAESDVEWTEFEYEFRAALAYGTSGDWVLVALSDGGTELGWVPPDHRGPFHSLANLLDRRLTYFTESWVGQLRVAPSQAAATLPLPPTATWDINVREALQQQDGLWLRVEVLGPGRCRDDPPPVVAEGWVPALNPLGRRVVWYHSRGC